MLFSEVYVCIYINIYIYILCTLEESTLRVLGGNLNLQSRIENLELQYVQAAFLMLLIAAVRMRTGILQTFANVCRYAGDVASCRKDVFFEVQMFNSKKKLNRKWEKASF